MLTDTKNSVLQGKRAILDQIQALVRRGCIFIVNHSGGKDSQAMLIFLRTIVPDGQLVIVHADLGEVVWAGEQEHIRRYAHGIPVYVVGATYRDGSKKELIDLIIKNEDVPNAANRTCTSELKTGPVEKWIRRSGHQLVVNCLGIRAGESCNREKGLDKKHFDKTGEAVTLRFDEELSAAGREVCTWLPIFDLTTEQVFEQIAQAGQEVHWAYRAGMSRLSCSLCVLASGKDLTQAARLRADLYARYVALEKWLGRPVHVSKRPLEQITGIQADEAQVEKALEEHQATRESIVARGLQRVRRTKREVA
jgi:DNA sulfur modification protein DndC